jgi:SAM-dependent methyltransferase
MGLTVGRQHTLWMAEWRRERFPAALALRMLMLGDPLTEEEASTAVGSELFTALRDAGMIVCKEDGWASPFTLSFLDELFLFSDRTTMEPDGVVAVSNTTQLLARASCPEVDSNRSYNHVLDLGCGCGALAIRLAQFSQRVLATDVNSRALAFGRFNAALNGVTNVVFRQGDMFAPADGEKFDLIMCQPPFVARTPDTEYVVFLHAGAEGDEIAQRVLSGCLDHLRPNGRLVMLNDWPMHKGGEASVVNRVKTVLSRLNAHVVVLLSEPVDIAAHCASYASPGASGAESTLALQIGTSLDHFASRGIVAIRQALSIVEHRADDTDGGYELHVPPARWTNTTFTDIDRIFVALRFQTDGIAGHLSSRVRVAPGTSFLCRWTDAPEEGQLYAEPPGDVLFPLLPLNAGALQLIKTLDAAPNLKEAIGKLALTESLPPEVLYSQVESALVTGLTRGILCLIPRPIGSRDDGQSRE